MRSVCALNFEAMSILDPADQNSAAALMQKELEKQVQNAMDYSGNDADAKSDLSFTLSEKQDHGAGSAEDAQREMMNMALAMQHEPAMDPNNRKIESKDSMWKPAPIVGREPTSMRYQ